MLLFLKIWDEILALLKSIRIFSLTSVKPEFHCYSLAFTHQTALTRSRNKFSPPEKLLSLVNTPVFLRELRDQWGFMWNTHLFANILVVKLSKMMFRGKGSLCRRAGKQPEPAILDFSEICHKGKIQCYFDINQLTGLYPNLISLNSFPVDWMEKLCSQI